PIAAAASAWVCPRFARTAVRLLARNVSAIGPLRSPHPAMLDAEDAALVAEVDLIRPRLFLGREDDVGERHLFDGLVARLGSKVVGGQLDDLAFHASLVPLNPRAGLSPAAGMTVRSFPSAGVSPDCGAK